MNISWSKKILESLYAAGVRDLVYCAGARNSPFISLLAKARGIETYSYFEERSAGFFALGIARRENRPVAILTTSGTAAANLLPAIIEAFHVGVPLVAVTADRPKRLRGTGAPQAIDQTGLFQKFINVEFDLEDGELPDLSGWKKRSPIHLNVCFDEPLIDEEIQELALSEQVSDSSEPSKGFKGQSRSKIKDRPAAQRLKSFIDNSDSLLVTVGTLETEAERAEVTRLLKMLKVPCYLESTSGLRESAELENIALRSGDQVLSWALKQKLVTHVLRIGGVPTVRIWRDLDLPSSEISVFSLSSLPFAGLSRGELVCDNISLVLNDVMASDLSEPKSNDRLLEKDKAAARALETLFESEPKAEPSLVRALSLAISEKSLVYVGNSLPIREWDLAATHSKANAVEANRGVNGIDGQTSTFYGLCREKGENWAVIGDLTALYDLSAPWALAQREIQHSCVVVINNGGGKIFGRIFGNAEFENRHALGFSSWAAQWNLGYKRWETVPGKADLAGHSIIELIPDPEATTRFWNHYEKVIFG